MCRKTSKSSGDECNRVFKSYDGLFARSFSVQDIY